MPLFPEGQHKMPLFLNTQRFSGALNIQKAIKRPTRGTKFNLNELKKHHISYIVPRPSSK